jgi:hypothetical protein
MLTRTLKSVKKRKIKMGYQGSNGLLFQITVVRLAKGMLFLPFFGAIFCIVWSIIFDFESSTSTHCRVSNTNSILIRIESGSFLHLHGTC